MNAGLQILLTALLVAGGVGGYHVLTADRGPADYDEPSLVAASDLRDLQARVSSLEGQEPMLQGNVSSQDLYDQVRALADRVRKLEQGSPADATAVGRTSSLDEEAGTGTGPAPVGDTTRALLEDGPSPLTEAQEKRVRDLVDNQMRSRMRGREAGRIDRTLQQLGIELNDEQKTKLEAAMNERRAAMGELWRSARESGQSRDETRASMEEQMATLNREFTQKLTEFIPAGDAEAIGASLTSFGGRGPGSRGGGRSGGR